MGLHIILAGNWRPTRRQWRVWAGWEPVLRGLSYDQLRVLLDVTGRTPGTRADVLLAALWRLARHDRDAGRLLVACLLPALRSLAGRYRATLGHEEAFMVAVAAVWDRVARFGPPAGHVAYRLTWLAGRRLNQAATSQRAHARLLRDADPPPATAEPGGLPMRVLLGQAVAAKVISRRDAWLVWATYCAGLTLIEAAQVAGVGYEAAKKSRQRAKARLRAWLEREAA